jgi:tetratricopeptide (TPR) repeat protein
MSPPGLRYHHGSDSWLGLEAIMNSFFRLLLSLPVGLTVVVPVTACLWDYDTLTMERQRFPDTLQLVTGQFLRHTPAFYQWRIEDRLERIKQQPSPELYDDLAVAYEKTGDVEKAIAITLEKEKVYPGLYETLANLGTFYIHAGQLEMGVEQIDLAIALNPDAHFGREVYQRLLVKYVLAKRSSGRQGLPLDVNRRGWARLSGFAKYLIEAQSVENDPQQRDETLNKALKGILGMMRFGNYQSPILLEALGDLLGSLGTEKDAKRLAARAFLKASYEVKNEGERAAYRKMADDSLDMQTVNHASKDELSLEALEKKFTEELVQANQWFESIADDELAWIKAGLNVDEAFSKKYYRQPALNTSQKFEPTIVMSGILGLAFLVGLYVISRKRDAAGSSKLGQS